MPPLVLIHGNPETPAVWDHLMPSLRGAGREPTFLSPPGFGAPVPDGFRVTPEGYLDWLVESLEPVGEPVDIVGHDWGGGFVAMLAMRRPALVRTWASDALGLFHPDYVWHDLAQIWQAAPDGERWVADTAEDAAAWARTLTSIGMAAPTAEALAPAFDAEMGRVILSLYRAAAQPAMADYGRQLDAAGRRPGLAIIAHDDVSVGTLAQRREAARAAHAATVELSGEGHWWMTQGDHRLVMAALRSLWASG
jgi:pimeloyl-ACP methyl ester carboxylesterase